MNTTADLTANDHANRMKQAFRLVDPTCKELGRDWKDPIDTYGTELAIEHTCEQLRQRCLA